MSLSTTAYFCLLGLFIVGTAAVLVSVSILRQGKLYHRMKPQSRPRRWVLLWLLVLIAVFAICFPVWLIWPHSVTSRILLGLFGLTFIVVGIALQRFSWLVDWYYKRKGWPLR